MLSAQEEYDFSCVLEKLWESRPVYDGGFGGEGKGAGSGRRSGKNVFMRWVVSYGMGHWKRFGHYVVG